MMDTLKTAAAKTLGVTVALTAGALVIAAALNVLAQVVSTGGMANEVDNWYRVDLLIVGTAALAGVVADTIRWVAAALWHARPDPRTLLTGIMRQNLA